MSQLEDLLQRCTVKLTLPSRMGWGTGFFVAPGLILTCAHVVQEAKGESVQVRWQKQENWAQAVVERSLPEPHDLALLRVTLPTDANPPCVYLDGAIQSRDPLYLFGYPDQDFPNGCPVTFDCEGLTGDEPALIKFALGQVRPGMSGSPLLNQRTGKVCGIVKFTRDRSFDLGGGAIPTSVILEQFPQLREPDIDVLVKQVRSFGYGKIKEEIGVVRMLRGDPNQVVPIDNIYIDLNVLKQTNATLLEPITITDNQESQPALKEIRRNRKLMLLGKPGSGKTTLLRWLAVQCIEQKLGWEEPDLIPVYLILRNFERELNLLPAIQRELENWKYNIGSETAKKLAEAGRLLLLLDGLDEVPEAEEKRIVQQIDSFCWQYDKNRVIVSQRMQQNYSFNSSIKDIEIAGFNIEQVKQFVEKWFFILSDKTSEKTAKSLIRQLQEPTNKITTELASTPVLLNLICLVNLNTSNKGELPEKRSDLYKRGVKVLLTKWNKGRVERLKIPDINMSKEEFLEPLLAEVAYALFEKDNYNPDSEDLKRLISQKLNISRSEAEIFLTAFETESGIITRTSEENFSFLHQGFIEYFTAKHIANSKTIKQELEDLVTHIYELRWREIFLMVVELLNDSDYLVKLMKTKLDALLAENEKLQQLLTWANQKALWVGVPYNSENLNGFSNFSNERLQASVRAFYCANALSYALNLEHTRDRAGDRANDLVVALSPNLSLNRVFAIALDHEHKSTLNYNLVRDRALTGILTFAYDLNQKLSLDPNFRFASTLISTLASLLNDVLTNKFIPWNNSDLEQSLLNLEDELPKLDVKSLNQWSEQLREILIEHRVVSNNHWQFSEDETDKIASYFESNKLLVECLDKARKITPSVKKEIETTFLLF